VTSIDLRAGDPRVRLAGICELTTMERGALTERLPAWARAQLVDPAIGFVSSMPSGGRLEFVTDATSIELEAVFTRLEYAGITPHTATIDLVVDGESVASEALDRDRRDPVPRPGMATEFEIVHHEPSTVRFDGLPRPQARRDLARAERIVHAANAPPRRWRHDRAAAGVGASPVGALRQLDQPLHGGRSPDRCVACGGRPRPPASTCTASDSPGSASSTSSPPGRSATFPPT
jgi:hypothetical protein